MGMAQIVRSNVRGKTRPSANGRPIEVHLADEGSIGALDHDDSSDNQTAETNSEITPMPRANHHSRCRCLNQHGWSERPIAIPKSSHPESAADCSTSSPTE